MLKPARARQLSALASSIAEAYFPGGFVQPEQIAKANSITFSYGSYGDYFDGMLEHESGLFHIYINLEKLKSVENPRTRFTFAHELGHYFIDEHRISLKKGITPPHQSLANFSSKNAVEVEADFFAASLLMPERSFKEYCKGEKFSPQLIMDLSDHYNTSLSATAIRYCDIGNHPIMLICARNGSVLWNWKSVDFQFEYLKTHQGKVPGSTVAGEFFRLKRQFNVPETVYAEDWFHYVEFPPNTFQLFEYCFYAPQKNFVMSLLWYK